jgi:hypothetical protein
MSPDGRGDEHPDSWRAAIRSWLSAASMPMAVEWSATTVLADTTDTLIELLEI